MALAHGCAVFSKMSDRSALRLIAAATREN